MSNRLAEETSPYLLQHAENPVDWYPWGPEALARARREDRPILLSIGYSSCHWCHVMAHESFEDEGTAALMNDAFVNVKVDREERPDVDSVYMRAVQALTGRGGWPLTVFLTPDGEPYYGGTYFPPEPRHGMPAFQQVLRAVRNAWDERREEVASTATRLRELLERSSSETPGDGSTAAAGRSLARHAYRFMAARYDETHGGFGQAPKFPQPVTLEMLLRWSRLADEAAERRTALEMVTGTLRRMARGGIRDHLGGGFHRYSVDRRWLVPHFEKMLYDNALLARLYVQAWQVTTGSERPDRSGASADSPDPSRAPGPSRGPGAVLLDAAESTLRWLLDDMRDPGGGFYSARDADSEGEEGRYYVWTPSELEAVLGADRARRFGRVYDVTEAGNFEGRSILHLPHEPEAVARREEVSPEELARELERDRSALLDARRRRVPPLRDEKVLAAWNGMTARAFAEAGGALDRPEYVDVAVSTLDFLLGAMRTDDGRLLRTWSAGEAKIGGFLEDYAAVGNALVTTWEVTLDPRWLPEIRWAAESALEHFRDPDTGLFHDTAADAERLVVRPREVMDKATPSGTSLAAELLLRAGHLLGEDDWSGAAREAIRREAAAMERFPSAFGRLLSLVIGQVEPPVEVALLGGLESHGGRALRRAVLRRYLPGRTLAGREAETELPERVPLLEDREPVEGRPTVFVCRSFACRRPVTTLADLEEELDAV